MMYYFYIFFIPIVIIGASFYLEGKPTEKRNFVNFSFKIFKTFITYALLLYYLESENFINSGYSFLTVFMFTLLFGILIIPFKIYFMIKKDK